MSADLAGDAPLDPTRRPPAGDAWAELELDRALDQAVLAALDLNDLERYAVAMVAEAGLTRRYVAELTGLSRRRLDEVLAYVLLALRGELPDHFRRHRRYP